MRFCAKSKASLKKTASNRRFFGRSGAAGGNLAVFSNFFLH
jgi:hypothetical protein